MLWKQKANIKWLVEGDRNTKKIHQTVQQRKQRLHLHRIRNESGNWLIDIQDIKTEAMHAFQTQLNGSHTYEGDTMLDKIPRIIIAEQNEHLSAFLTREEIHTVIRSMNGDSAPRPDGYNGFFYNTCWDIIKDDLYDVISEFFAGGELPKSWTSIILLPVPKVNNPSSFEQLRPIRFCNFSSKILAKLLMVRLSPILPSFISAEQNGFEHGRMIHDNILLAQELISSIKKKIRGLNIIMKCL